MILISYMLFIGILFLCGLSIVNGLRYYTDMRCNPAIQLSVGSVFASSMSGIVEDEISSCLQTCAVTPTCVAITLQSDGMCKMSKACLYERKISGTPSKYYAAPRGVFTGIVNISDSRLFKTCNVPSSTILVQDVAVSNVEECATLCKDTAGCSRFELHYINLCTIYSSCSDPMDELDLDMFIGYIPTTNAPTTAPTKTPSRSPTPSPTSPTPPTTASPTGTPTFSPTGQPTAPTPPTTPNPTLSPTTNPTKSPTRQPTVLPTTSTHTQSYRCYDPIGENRIAQHTYPPAIPDNDSRYDLTRAEYCRGLCTQETECIASNLDDLDRCVLYKHCSPEVVNDQFFLSPRRQFGTTTTVESYLAKTCLGSSSKTILTQTSGVTAQSCAISCDEDPQCNYFEVVKAGDDHDCSMFSSCTPVSSTYTAHAFNLVGRVMTKTPTSSPTPGTTSPPASFFDWLPYGLGGGGGLLGLGGTGACLYYWFFMRDRRRDDDRREP